MSRERTMWEGKLEDGTTLVVTESFGRIVDGSETVKEWPWVNYASGEWEGEAGTFEATAIADDVDDLILEFGPQTDISVGLVISDRIESSIVYQETALVTDAGWVRVFVRRNPDGTMFTQSLGFNIDDADPATVEKVVLELEYAVREAVGMPID
ncbi:MAG: hypothetical protein ACTHWJ_03455 [Flaviflexus sp.]|uniref:Uncharacterized protein n=1 Tax=Flaviflexus ciconiae TaxID=2496867 RepID=A0A3S9PV89_9ACTO|nr:hypothetical protein [Flaviflexus ciconiae]AZQ76273.1 hypothetical protein EJ997_01880 [Flaviflexus ciconiae]